MLHVWLYHILFSIHQLGYISVVSAFELFWIMLLMVCMCHSLLFKSNNSSPQIEVNFSIRCGLLPYPFPPDLYSRTPQTATKVPINVLINSLRGLKRPEKERLVNLITCLLFCDGLWGTVSQMPSIFTENKWEEFDLNLSKKHFSWAYRSTFYMPVDAITLISHIIKIKPM